MDAKGTDCRLNTRATSIVMDNGAAKDVVVDGPEGTYTIPAGAVILAMGGYANNSDPTGGSGSLYDL